MICNYEFIGISFDPLATFSAVVGSAARRTIKITDPDYVSVISMIYE